MVKNKEIHVERVQHKGYTEWIRYQNRSRGKKGWPTLRRFFGRWQYLYTFKGMTVSLIYLTPAGADPINGTYKNGVWEVAQLGGPKIIEGVERVHDRHVAVYFLRKRLEEGPTWKNMIKYKIKKWTKKNSKKQLEKH